MNRDEGEYKEIVMSAKNVVIAWTQDDITKNALAKFKSGIKKTFLSIPGLTDEEHIKFVDYKEQVDKVAQDGSCDILLVSEELGGVKIGKGAVRVWRGDNPNMRIIMVVADDRKTSGKLKGMFDNLYFDALYFKDFKKSKIQALVKSSRSEADAYDYYGLADFVDPFGEGVDVSPAEELKARDEKSPIDKEGDIKEKKGQKVVQKTPTKKDIKNTEKPVKKAPLKQNAENTASDGDTPEEVKKNKVQIPLKTKDTGKEPVTEIKKTLKGIEKASEPAPVIKKKEKEVITDAEKSEEILKRPVKEVKGKTSDGSLGDFEFDINVERSEEELLSYLSRKQHESLDPPKVMRYEPNATDIVAESLLKHFTQEDTTSISNLELHLMSEQAFMNEVNKYISEHYDVTADVAQAAFDNFMQFMFNYDVITELIEDRNITDIKIYDNDNVRIKYNGKRLEAPVKFRSVEHYRAFVSHLAHRNHVSISGEDAIVHFTDTASSDTARLRVNISTEFVNSDGLPCVHIRKVNNQKYTTQQLIEAGMFTPRIAAYLVNAVQNDTGIVFTGKGSAGKTSLMNWAIDYIPRNMSGLCIQESDELFSNVHPDILFQRIADDKDNKKNYDLKTLAINGLLTDIDYFIIGEIKGAEAKYFLNAAYTGNRCWASVHSPGSKGALPKIADYAKYESDYTRDDLLQMLTSLSNLVFLKNFRVAQLSKVKGWDNIEKEVIYKDIDLDEVNRRKAFPVKKATK